MPHRRVGRLTVDDSDGDVTIRLGEWRDRGVSVNRNTALGAGAFATAALTAIASVAAGELVLLVPTVFLGMAGGAAFARSERSTVVEVRARGTVLHLLDRRGRIRREIPIDAVDQVGIGRDGKGASLWVQRGMEREPVFLGLELEEAELASDALDRRVQLPKEPYR